MAGAANTPRLLVAGVASAVGKTSLTVGLIRTLRDRGLRVQPFKVGPDYIDPSYLALAAGRPCQNLDVWMVGADRTPALFAAACRDADVAIIEGMMGAFDGHAPESDAGSAAEVARLLRAPVVLVVDGSAMARSAAAVVLGFRDLDPTLWLGGVVTNRVGGEAHAMLLRRAIEPATGVPVFGWLPYTAAAALPERHLGLIPVREFASAGRAAGALAEVVAQHVDIDALLVLARSAPAVPSPCETGLPHRDAGQPSSARIAIAMDEAFTFYYADTLDLLRAAGADLVPFSPLRDARLPEGVGGIYLGGGYPEEHAAELAANETMRTSVRAAIDAGLPCYAECGGLMYLCTALQAADGQRYPMVGAVAAVSRMRAGPGALTLGYREATALRDTLLCRAGDVVRGHEFHHSTLLEPVAHDTAAYRFAETGEIEGYARANLLASYLHLPLAGFPTGAERFVAACAARRV